MFTDNFVAPLKDLLELSMFLITLFYLSYDMEATFGYMSRERDAPFHLKEVLQTRNCLVARRLELSLRRILAVTQTNSCTDFHLAVGSQNSSLGPQSTSHGRGHQYK
jgi:hypothetical protein